jgi:hypothetical protein
MAVSALTARARTVAPQTLGRASVESLQAATANPKTTPPAHSNRGFRSGKEMPQAPSRFPMSAILASNTSSNPEYRFRGFPATILWTQYLFSRAELRGFEVPQREQILRYTEERHFDTVTHRMVAVGKHRDFLVTIPYDIADDQTITPVTVYATSGQ